MCRERTIRLDQMRRIIIAIYIADVVRSSFEWYSNKLIMISIAGLDRDFDRWSIHFLVTLQEDGQHACRIFVKNKRKNYLVNRCISFQVSYFHFSRLDLSFFIERASTHVHLALRDRLLHCRRVLKCPSDGLFSMFLASLLISIDSIVHCKSVSCR